MNPTLSLLICTIPQRRDSFQFLVAELFKQVSQFSPGTVEVLVDGDATARSGVKRQRLLSQVQGTYCAFIDDDDAVAPDYVAKMLDAARHSPSVITFDLSFRRLRPSSTVSHAERWSYRLLPDNRPKGLMTANHLCAWRTEIAQKVGWCPYLGYGDDQLWYKPLFLAYGDALTEIHIADHPLYFYQYSPEGTVNQRMDQIHYGRSYAGGGLRVWKYRETGCLFVEAGRHQQTLTPVDGFCECINYKGAQQLVNLKPLDCLGTVRIN